MKPDLFDSSNIYGIENYMIEKCIYTLLICRFKKYIPENASYA